MCACNIIGNVLPTQLAHTYKQYNALNRVHLELNRSASGENAVMSVHRHDILYSLKSLYCTK